MVHLSDFHNFIPFLKNESVKLLVTSPPYEDAINYRDKGRIVTSGSTGREYVEMYFTSMFDLMWRKLRPDGLMCIVVNEMRDKRGTRSLSTVVHRGIVEVVDNGWYLVEEIPWIKTQAIPSGGSQLQDWWEHILIFAKSGQYKHYPDRIRGDYIGEVNSRIKYTTPIGKMRSRKISKGEDEDEKRREIKQNELGKLMPNILVLAPDMTASGYELRKNHPARFPINLAEYLITLCSNEGDLVYDPMTGSGSTWIAAKQTGRKFIGSDITPEYIDIATRCANDTSKQEVLF